MNEVIIVNKEKGMTSRDVVNSLNKILKTKKIGHTGTLDPIAEGVLVVCIGQATKLCEVLTANYKEYVAEIKLGLSTDTMDITGSTLKKEKIHEYTEDEINNVLQSFLGKSIQEVPIYSAVKVNGKKLYEYARNNIEVELPKREIEITDIELLDYHDDLIKFRCVVSKGTYIRSLINDICLKLNTIGTMNKLVRTKQGIFKIENAYFLEDIKNGNYKSLDLKEVLQNYKQVNLNEKEYFRVKNGQPLKNTYHEKYVVFLYNQKVIAMYKDNNGILKMFKMLDI